MNDMVQVHPTPADPVDASAPVRWKPRGDLRPPDVTEAVAGAALLADRTRASIIRMLADGPYCVCELASALGERENNVSNHLARLRDAGLVRATRHEANARFLCYERDAEAAERILRAVREVLTGDRRHEAGR